MGLGFQHGGSCDRTGLGLVLLRVGAGEMKRARAWVFRWSFEDSGGVFRSGIPKCW